MENVRNQGIRQVPAPHVYLSGATTGPFNPLILVRTSTDPNQVLNAVRGEIAIVDRRVALRQPGKLQESARQERLLAAPLQPDRARHLCRDRYVSGWLSVSSA